MKGTLSETCENLSHLIADAFPAPDPESLAVSDALVERIRAEIEARGGWLGFERFMELALYEPGMGYYSAGSTKLGRAGDFTTAPELGDWFASALAVFLDRALAACESSSLLELGAGSGRLAAALIAGLRERGHAGVDYAILETSADLHQRQREHLGAVSESARWLERLPEQPFRGVVVANEVADALPVTRFRKCGGAVLPVGVRWDRAGFSLDVGPADVALAAAVAEIEDSLGWSLPDGYESEICLALRPWVTTLLETIAAGGMLLIDYGMPSRDYYRLERADGTLICHYRQRAHTNPLLWPGLQDLTAWVDFSAVAAAARQADCRIAGYTTLAQFLLETLASDEALGPEVSPLAASQLKTLILPGEMGERFKLLWVTSGIDGPALPGRDFRNWL